MVDYKKIADLFEKNSTENPVMDKEKFLKMMERRRFNKIKSIDTVNGFSREVWGNVNFEIIVKHNGVLYQEL